MSTKNPISRVKLSDQVQRRLLSIIETEGLEPGDVLPSERELMERYAVGRPAIREAMQNLQRMGLVEIKHGERPRVAEPSFDRMVGQMSESMRHILVHSSTSLSHLKEARATFEMEMARIASRKQTPKDIADLKDILKKQESVRLLSPAFLEWDGRFHHRIAVISGNPIFSSLSRALFDWLAQFHFDLVRKPGLEQLTLSEHWQILEAIERGDADDAARFMSEHLNRANSLYHQDNYSLRK
ncbi:transcriptional regulator NanR [Solirhodobacter olei]|uniref:transcriptional regulator NanR n=1 Tax=Solirhodobacter olei TaxID=2493082 RepID=UPI000FDC1F43|nr:transcriptional regulator NanR [Solirhodobacter olei]